MRKVWDSAWARAGSGGNIGKYSGQNGKKSLFQNAASLKLFA